MSIPTIDPNLITAQWGLIGAFGVAVTLLAPRADQYRQEYIRSDSDLDLRRTSQWVRLVRITPVAVLVAVILLTALAAPAAPSNWTEARQEYSILTLPILAQLGFIYILWRLVLQQHFVICSLPSLVVAGPGAVLVVPAPAGPGPCGGSAGGCGDQVCQETADLAERDRDEAAARAFGAVAAVTDRYACASMAKVMCRYQAS